MDPFIAGTVIFSAIIFRLFVLGIIGGGAFVAYRILTDRKSN